MKLTAGTTWLAAVVAVLGCLLLSLRHTAADVSIDMNIAGDTIIEVPVKKFVSPKGAAAVAGTTFLQSGYQTFRRAQLGDKEATRVLLKAAEQTADPTDVLYGNDDVALTQTAYLMLTYALGTSDVLKNWTRADELAAQVSPFLQRQLRTVPETDPDFPYVSLMAALVYAGRWGFAANEGNADEGAVRYVRIAAEAHLTTAQTTLASWYIQGLHGLDKDPATAFTWYRRAAESGDPYGELFFGLCFYYGHGVDKDQTEALRWFQKSADQGFSEAEYLVGHCYSTGQGTGQIDNAQAVRWFERAATRGQRDAQFSLGWYYNTGLGGKARDVELARQWYTKAADQGHQDAPFFLPSTELIFLLASAVDVVYPYVAVLRPYYATAYDWVVGVVYPAK